MKVRLELRVEGLGWEKEEGWREEIAVRSCVRREKKDNRENQWEQDNNKERWLSMDGKDNRASFIACLAFDMK